MQPDKLIQLRIFQADIIICRIADMMRVMAGPLAIAVIVIIIFKVRGGKK